MPNERADGFQDFLVGIGEIIETKDPSLWWSGVYRYLRRQEREIWQQPLAVQEHFWRHIGTVYEILREEAVRPRSGNRYGNNVALEASIVIERISRGLTADVNHDPERFPVEFVPIDYLLNNSRFRIDRRRRGTFQVYSRSRRSWFGFPLPSDETVMHKGGLSRLALKIVSGAPEFTIEAELPPNDLDVVTTMDRKGATAEAREMGIDLAGVEIVEEFDFPRIFSDRDMDINGCLLGRDGLVFSPQAYRAAQTGRIALVGGYTKERALFGADRFVYGEDKVVLTKPRGIMRLVKFVAEGKALSFDFLPLNQQIELNLYWLVLARKFGSKKNHGELLSRLLYLGQKIGQVKNRETIFDILDRTHQQYPFFDFEAPEMDETSLALWFGRKLLKQADREFRWLNQIPSDLLLTRFPNDTVPYTISLIGYTPNPSEIRFIEQEWSGFLERCRRRTRAFNRQEKDLRRILFYR